VCDRILVMYGGRVINEFIAGDELTTPENILFAIEGGSGHVQSQVDAVRS